jgi:hypothetical protein
VAAEIEGQADRAEPLDGRLRALPVAGLAAVDPVDEQDPGTPVAGP